MKEIERKYVAGIEVEPDFKAVDKWMYVRQGYLFVSRLVEWRLRHTKYTVPYVRHGWFTAIKVGNGFVRKEYEIEIPHLLGEMLSYFVPSWLHKRRIELGGWSIDTFGGHLKGLHLAEAEIECEHDPLPPPPVGISLLRDVTDEGTFANKWLSRLKAPEAESLVESLVA